MSVEIIQDINSMDNGLKYLLLISSLAIFNFIVRQKFYFYLLRIFYKYLYYYF